MPVLTRTWESESKKVRERSWMADTLTDREHADSWPPAWAQRARLRAGLQSRRAYGRDAPGETLGSKGALADGDVTFAAGHDLVPALAWRQHDGARASCRSERRGVPGAAR